MNHNPYDNGVLNYHGYGYYSNFYGDPYFNQVPQPSKLLAYGPYQEGPSSQMTPPDWFAYYAHTNPYINPAYFSNMAYYMNPQFLPRFR